MENSVDVLKICLFFKMLANQMNRSLKKITLKIQ